MCLCHVAQRSVFCSLIYIFLLQLRVVLDDLISIVSVTQEFQNEINCDTKISDGRFALANIRINGYSVEHGLAISNERFI